MTRFKTAVLEFGAHFFFMVVAPLFLTFVVIVVISAVMNFTSGK